MDEKNKTTITENGMFLRGVCIHNDARTGLKKDGSRWVRVQHDIAMQSNVVIWEQYFDPEKDPSIKVQGEEVKTYPKLKEFEPLSLKVSKFKFFNDQLIIQRAQVI